MIGVDVDAQAVRVAGDVRRVGREAAGPFGVAERWVDACVEVAGVVRPGYGVPDTTTDEAISLAARLEGLALDPVYAGKGMAGLIGLARAGRFGRGQALCGFIPAAFRGVFAYPDTMARASNGAT